MILSAGGKYAYFDLVAERLGGAPARRDSRVVIRSGCYLSHDSRHVCQGVRPESNTAPAPPPRWARACARQLEVWSYVQSAAGADPRPPDTRQARTRPFDAGMPVPARRFRPGNGHGAPTGRPGPCGWSAMNDQHAFLDLPADSDLAVRRTWSPAASPIPA